MGIQPYEAEDVLQKLVADYPGVLAGEGQTSERRFALIKREAGIPSHAGGADRWSLDHLFVDDEAVPTFVEVKRRTDNRIRREVVGQMLDYAANGLSYWRVETLRENFESTQTGRGEDPAEVLRELLANEDDPEAFWERVRTNLAARKVRLVFVADDVPDELRALIEFLNEQMRSVEVLGLEVKQYAGEGGLRTLVAAAVGQTQAAQQAKGDHEPGPRGRLYKEFWEQFLPQLHARYPGWSKTNKASTVSWLELPARKTNIAYSINFTGTRRLRGEVYLYKGSETFPQLVAQKDEIERAFGEPLAWEELPEKQASRIAVYGEGDVGQVDTWPAYTKWFLDTAGRLRSVFQPHIDAL
ncbi:MAG: DUF4268 domain-containing protein [Actinomycetota bacterium]|nr:DUF4268 domain-containing protein [Actinomycetota bacterium]